MSTKKPKKVIPKTTYSILFKEETISILVTDLNIDKPTYPQTKSNTITTTPTYKKPYYYIKPSTQSKTISTTPNSIN